MKPLIIQMANGITMAVWTTISAVRVSYRPRFRNIRKNGSTITTGGRNCVASTATISDLCANSRKRENE
ncbi:hypothetical protein R69746_08829 [Paraburkholderia aspalathi]|nr:hypothetical protein R69746_08829 [Paraburkholderia aspalathi]